ncbi:MAG: YbgA family protein [Thermodesulfobacteriota bacterium]
MPDPIRLGVSSCLLGENVRWNGGHKLDHFLKDTLGQFVEFVPVCPEVEAGFGIPRETMRLEGDADNPRLVTTKSKIDHTEQMRQWAENRVRQLEKENLCGFIFKKDSPSSGLTRVKVYNAKGMPEKKGVGLFAREFIRHFPLIPVEEEGRLHDPRLRENFIELIFTLKRWRDTVVQKPGIGPVVDFHSRNKLLLMAHSPEKARMMGKLVGSAKQMGADAFYRQYEEKLVEAMRLQPTVKKHINVLHHIMGYFKKQLTADEKAELLEIIEQFRSGYVPLLVPMTLINHYARKYDQPYLRQQTYLNPHPIELKLRTYS